MQFERLFSLFNKNSQEDLLENATLLSFVSFFIYNDFNKLGDAKVKQTLTDLIKIFLLENLDKRVSLHDISEKFSFSKLHIQTRFKKETGCPLLVFFNLKKIQKAS